jgi:hypothetical protein
LRREVKMTRMMLGGGAGFLSHGSSSSLLQLLLAGGTWWSMMGVFVAAGVSMCLVCALVSMVLALCAAHGDSSVDGTESECSFHEEAAAAANPTTPERKLGHNAASSSLNASLSKMSSFRKSSFRKMHCKQVDVVEHAVGSVKCKSADQTLYVVEKSETEQKPPQLLAAAEAESAADSDDVGGSAAAAAPAAPAVWQRAILRGNRCAPLAFSGLILYDEQGRPLRNFNTDREQSYQTHCRSQTIS